MVYSIHAGTRVVMRRREPRGGEHGGIDERVGPLWPLGMTAEPSVALSAGAQVRVPGTEADGVRRYDPGRLNTGCPLGPGSSHVRYVNNE